MGEDKSVLGEVLKKLKTQGNFDISVCNGVKDIDDNPKFKKLGYYGDDDDNDDIPEGCAACGGPWPDCETSCNIFDD